MATERPVEKEIARAIAIHKRGIMTRWEIIRMIAGYATEPGFFGCLEGLPPEVVEGLREIAADAPAHPEDVVLGNALYQPMTQEEFNAMRRRARVGAYWTGRALRAHFFPDRPLPPFEPRRRVGVVDESTAVDGSVALFGVEQTFIIHDHPVHCVPPSGGLIVTSVIRQGYVRGPGDEVGDAFRRHYGRYGLFLDANVRSPSEVPRGTEVWVDRSAASDIPPLPDLE